MPPIGEPTNTLAPEGTVTPATVVVVRQVHTPDCSRLKCLMIFPRSSSNVAVCLVLGRCELNAPGLPSPVTRYSAPRDRHSPHSSPERPQRSGAKLSGVCVPTFGFHRFRALAAQCRYAA